MASSTTMPGTTSTMYSLKWPPAGSVRQTLNDARLICVAARSRLLLLDHLLELRRHGGDRHAPDLHRPSRPLARHDVEGRVFGILVRIVLTEVPTPALPALDRRARDRLRDSQEVAQIDRRVPARVVFAVSLDTGVRGARRQ